MRPTLLHALAAALVLLPCCGGPPPETAAMADLDAFKSELREAGLYSGGKWELFETAGRSTFANAIANGLEPGDVVLDVGAGSLRVGWWFLHFIEPSNYHAIEPDRERFDKACAMLGVDLPAYYNDDFEFPERDFDFVIARSIWTHASKAMISKMISEFRKNSAPDGKFLASVLLASSPEEDYMGEEWVGKGVGEGKARIVRHSIDWIRAECKRHGLRVTVNENPNDHTWVVISR